MGISYPMHTLQRSLHALLTKLTTNQLLQAILFSILFYITYVYGLVPKVKIGISVVCMG